MKRFCAWAGLYLVVGAALAASVAVVYYSAQFLVNHQSKAPIETPAPPAVTIRCPEIVVKEGLASWYGAAWVGRKTAGGDPFDMEAYTLATLEFPIGSFVIVTNMENGKKCVGLINDHGPYYRTRMFDLSLAMAKKLGLVSKGVGRIRVQLVEVQ